MFSSVDGKILCFRRTIKNAAISCRARFYPIEYDNIVKITVPTRIIFLSYTIYVDINRTRRFPVNVSPPQTTLPSTEAGDRITRPTLDFCRRLLPDNKYSLWLYCRLSSTDRVWDCFPPHDDALILYRCRLWNEAVTGVERPNCFPTFSLRANFVPFSPRQLQASTIKIEI